MLNQGRLCVFSLSVRVTVFWEKADFSGGTKPRFVQWLSQLWVFSFRRKYRKQHLKLSLYLPVILLRFWVPMFPDDDPMPVTVRANLFSFLAASGGHQSKGGSPVGHITSPSSGLAIPGTNTLRGQGQTLNNTAFFFQDTFKNLGGYPGPPSLWSYTKKSLYLCSSISNSQGNWWALEGHRVSSKHPSNNLPHQLKTLSTHVEPISMADVQNRY